MPAVGNCVAVSFAATHYVDEICETKGYFFLHGATALVAQGLHIIEASR